MPGAFLWLLGPAIGHAWGLSPAQIGLLLAAHNLGGGLGYLPGGIIGDRFHQRGLMLLGTVWWVVIGYLVASMSPSYWLLATLLAIAAAGDAMWHPLATGTMVQDMPQRRALALGVHLTGGIMAEVVGPLAAGFLLVYFDWQTVLRVAIVPAILMGLGLLYFHRRVRSSTEPGLSRADFMAVLMAWRSRPGFLMLGFGVTYSMSFIGLMAMAPLYLQDYHGYSSAWAGSVFAAMLLGGVISAPVMGRISDGVGRRKIVVLSTLCAAFSMMVFAFANSLPLLIVSIVVAGTLLVGIRPVYLAAAMEMIGRREATSLGIIYALMDGLGAIGGVLAGIAGTHDLRFAFMFASAGALISGMFALANRDIDTYHFARTND
jgi:MFS family permease